jgi:hydroxymethylpyrimidine/phosphomethylpyrimidine kinase
VSAAAVSAAAVSTAALSIAGSDSGGGAGVVADAKTFAAHRVWACVAITAVTAQDPSGVRRVQVLDPELVQAQIDAVVREVGIDAVKTGMLGNASVVATVVGAVTSTLADAPLVVDPVVLSSSGAQLLDGAGLEQLRTHLIPRAWLVTPNLAEAGLLTGTAVHDRAGMERAARALVAAGSRAALVTGGHLDGEVVLDCLVVGDGDADWIEGPRLRGGSHGTGCVLSAAITARLALGEDIPGACRKGVAFVRAAIAAGGPAGVSPG